MWVSEKEVFSGKVYPGDSYFGLLDDASRSDKGNLLVWWRVVG